MNCPGIEPPSFCLQIIEVQERLDEEVSIDLRLNGDEIISLHETNETS